MTPKERVLAALARQEPDLVPHFEWILNPGVRRAMTGLESELDFIETMDIDGIAVDTDMRKVTIDSRYYKDEWGITRVSWDEYPNAVGHPIRTKEDLAGLAVPDPDAEYRFDSIKAAMDRFGEERAVIIRLRDVFSQPRDLMGFSDFLAGFYSEPELIQELMRVSVDYNTRLAANVRQLGGQIIVVGDDIAGTDGLLISPEMYRQSVYPHFRQLVQNFKALGFLVIKHSDGDIMPVMDDLVESGIDCIDPIEPRAGMDLKTMKSRYGGRVALKGNVDCVKTLVAGSPLEVRAAVKACIRAAGTGGGYIISSSNSIHAGVDPALYRVFLEARKELGRYPLDTDALEERDT
ncbi:MAG: uroporphyrinogen decarboxylase family protein [Spirochaetia bacterium]